MVSNKVNREKCEQILVIYYIPHKCLKSFKVARLPDNFVVRCKLLLCLDCLLVSAARERTENARAIYPMEEAPDSHNRPWDRFLFQDSERQKSFSRARDRESEMAMGCGG